MVEAKDRLIVALDVPTLPQARSLVEQLAPHVGMFKVGSQLYTAVGPEAVRVAQMFGGKVFLDLKFHDTPSTVERAAQEAALLGVEMFSVHCAPGTAVMAAARRGAENGAKVSGFPRPLALGVTVLTPHTYEELAEEELVRRAASPDEQFKREEIQSLVVLRALRARRAGLDGVVASPQEIGAVRRSCGLDFKIVTPGIRPAGAGADDQARVGTPTAAIKAGADYLVVGRPIIDASDPVAAAQAIVAEIAAALAEGR